MKPSQLFCAVILLSSSLPSLSLPPQVEQRGPCGVTMVLVGSSGDLATRYLWPAIFHNYQETQCLSGPRPAPADAHGGGQDLRGCEVLMLGGSRRVPEADAFGKLKELVRGVDCHTVSCEICLEKFVMSASRVRLSEERDYGALTRTLVNTYWSLNRTEVGRVFYLSVPPSAYEDIVQYIHHHGRPQEGAWLRVVLEKPFGRDLSSAKQLAEEVGRYLSEDEVYRVDHYLGKPGVQHILPFRRANSAILQSLWSSAHVQHVEVAVKERLDVGGRSGYFDKYGILRDMHQNHLTEVLTRLLVSTREETAFTERKMEFLSRLYPPTLRHAVLGQYAGYLAHLAQDGVPRLNSSTPTYATIALYSRDPQWSGVPFILTSGKQLGEREAYARIVFKKWLFSLTPHVPPSCPSEILFLIQDEVFKKPGILLSQHFSGMELKHGGLELVRSDVRLGNCSYIFLSPVHSDVPSSNAYVSLIADVLEGRKESFMDTESLLASWRVWDSLLSEIEGAGRHLQLHQYSPSNLSALDYHIEGRRLVSEADPARLGGDCASSSPDDVCDKISRLWGVRCVRGVKGRVYSHLAEDLHRHALESVQKRGVFHLALPGGKSPRPLFDTLSLDYTHVFPWKHTHIWQTDERCVQRNHSESNWNQIDELLLSHSHIPFHQLHPMPVELRAGVCVAEDGGCGLYESSLRGVTLDHVILGVGTDGHIASIFPPHLTPSPPRSEHVQLVRLNHTAPVSVKERMTLTYPPLLSARAISVLVAGPGKEGVREAMSADRKERVREAMLSDEVSDMPVLKLLVESTRSEVQVTLYITA